MLTAAQQFHAAAQAALPLDGTDGTDST